MALYINPLPPSVAVRKQKKKYFRGYFQFSIITIKKISPPWKPEIQSFRQFPKLKIAYFNGKIVSISLKLNFSPNTLGCYGLRLAKTG